MQWKFFAVAPMAALLGLTACANSMYRQQYAAPQPPTLTQTQGQCFSKFEHFSAQSNCINNAIMTSGIAPDAGIQEYLLLLKSLREKVERKALSENDARLRVASKLGELRALQQNEFAVQEQLANQRAAQNAEILRQFQYKAPLLEMPQRRSPVNTTCQTIGNQVNCTSRQW